MLLVKLEGNKIVRWRLGKETDNQLSGLYSIMSLLEVELV